MANFSIFVAKSGDICGKIWQNLGFQILQTPSPPPPFLSAIPHPAPTPTTSRRIQCNPSFNFVLLYPVYVCYIVILFVSDEATIKAKRFICFLKESRVTLSFVVKSKLVTVLSLFLFTFLQLPLAASMILGLNYVRSDSRVVI